MRISKIIHQTYSDKNLLSPEIIGNIEYLKNSNKGWEYRFYDDKDILDYVALNFGSKALSCIEKINKKYSVVIADLFRYMVVYKEGGVYLDIKSTAARPLDEIIKSEDAFLISQWRNQLGFKFQGWGLYDELKGVPGGEFQNWFVIAEKSHPFLLSAINSTLSNIDNYTVEKFGVGKKGVLQVSGPIMYTRAIVPLLKGNAVRIFDSASSGLIYSIYKNNREHSKNFKHNYARQIEEIVHNKPSNACS
jgi:hypothetical protein